MLLRLLIILLSCLVFIPCAQAQSSSDDAVNPNDIPPILDPQFRHQKSNQFEISPYGGSYLGNTLDQTWLTGAKGYYHLDNTWALGLAYGYSRLSPDATSAFGINLVNNNMHIADAEVMISNDAALRVGKKLLEMDFYMTFGAGAMSINNAWEPMGLVGGGVKFYSDAPWLAFRIDVNSYAHYTNAPLLKNFDFDTAFLGGISFLFPQGKNK
jgi:outer membrane beta-barrel protein